jgi:hypothetical protein
MFSLMIMALSGAWHEPFIKDHGSAAPVLAHSFGANAGVIDEASRTCKYGKYDGDEPALLACAAIVHQETIALQEGQLVDDGQKKVEFVKISLHLYST